MPQPGGRALRQFCAAHADDDGGAAGIFAAPVGGVLMAVPDRTGNQPRVRGKILVGSDVDQNRGLRRADQTGKFILGYGGVGLHGCALVKQNGTRYLGLSPRGEIAEPPDGHYSETRARCQCVLSGSSQQPGGTYLRASYIRGKDLQTMPPREPADALTLSRPMDARSRVSRSEARS